MGSDKLTQSVLETILILLVWLVNRDAKLELRELHVYLSSYFGVDSVEDMAE
jgi:hypothetical protein